MKKEKSIYVNIILNIIKVSLSIIFPFITFPYVSRVIMADNLGKVNYATSIENYFALIAVLGLNSYSIREGAKVRSDKEKIGTFANEIFTVSVINTVISYTLLVITLVAVRDFREYRLLIALLSISIILSTIGVDWLNNIFEDYLYITIRSFVVQVILLVLTFVIINKPEDYYKYAMLTVLSNGIVCILNFFYTRKYCRVRLIKKCNYFYHIKSLLVLFANNIAITIYLSADVTMLGLYTNDYTIGIYTVAVKAYNAIKAMISAMTSACLPRVSAYYGEGRMDEYKHLLNDLINNCTLLMLPTVCGLALLAEPVVLVLSGEGYIEATVALRLISLAIIGATYSGILITCVNLPMKREKYNLYATVVAAIVNVVLNIYFIPHYKEKGAAITTVIAEFTVFIMIFCGLSYKKLKELIYFKDVIRNIITGVAECAIMIGISVLLNAYTDNLFVITGLLIVLTIITYALLLIATKNPILNKFKFTRRFASNA